MKPYQVYERQNEFDGPISVLAENNPGIQRIIKQYAFGEIVTREEALCQMILLLAKDWDRIKQETYNKAIASTKLSYQTGF